MSFTVNSYFCGAGLMDKGLQNAGLTIGQAFELDAAAVKTYRHNFGNHIKHCDLTKELVLEQDSCDIMCFTYPCTSYSPIASIHNTRTGDELYLHALRHLAVASPQVFLIENVPGLKAYPLQMEVATKLPNYYIKTFCPVETTNWLPQRRKRLIIIGTKRKNNISPPDKCKPITLKSILEKNPRITYPKAIYQRMNGVYRDLPIISDPDKGDVAPTCVAHYSKDKRTRLVVDKRYPMGVRPYSVNEWAALQGLDSTFTFPVSDTESYKQIGNGVPVQMAEWAGREIIKYLKSNKGRVPSLSK